MPLYERYKDDERFEIVGVAVSDDPEKTLRAIGRHGYRWPQLTGCGDAPMKAYGFRSIPQLILFGPDGTVIARNTTVTDIIKQIDAALGK